MAQPPDLETRVAALEEQVRDLTARVRHSQQDAAAARVLAGAADRDVSELGTEIRDFREQNTRVLNAMRADLTDLREDLTDLRSRVGDEFIAVRGKLDAAAAGQQQILDLLTNLIEERGGQQGDA